MIRHQLTTSRRIRNLLIVDLLVLPPLFTAAFFGSEAPSHDLMTILMILLACAVVGAAITELVVTRPAASSTRRVAVLVPREPATYLSRPMRWWPTVGAVATVATLSLLKMRDISHAADGEHVSSGGTIVASLVVLAIPLASSLLSRWIVRRPQPFVSEDLVKADDALREATIRRIFGLGGAIIGLNLALWLFLSSVVADSATLGTILGVGALGSMVAAIVSFRTRQLRAPTPRRRRTAPA